ncbi:hypothetical protein POSPLADRAFT_1063702 [Postia placenta MAD-698-R-SB12]|uniref:Uncharacterized protein n=1 Tax=Postia placenta MAD-698-R-SB12 TaxID=670580 RepID=A0A1X6MH06_9APHY|nr:hypothetical protein POSPLADRAFT_1063702 [Postia placenta MAD-698-R-SB12]OSX55711.1 hypothetical protein POSPLADRAFT_1063702 [Postia placenta MAD-698-R-SB12]
MLGELNARRCIHPPSIHASWHAVSSAASSSPHRAVNLARSITPSRRAPSPAPVDDVRAISLSVASRSTASRNGIVWCATPRSLSLPPPSAAEQPDTARSSSLLQRTRLICRRYRSLDARTSVSCTATTAVVSATPQNAPRADCAASCYPAKTPAAILKMTSSVPHASTVKRRRTWDSRST